LKVIKRQQQLTSTTKTFFSSKILTTIIIAEDGDGVATSFGVEVGSKWKCSSSM
jgi:hypothetical protein